MANATLTSQITSGATVTSMAVTALPVAIPAGETLFVSLALTTVEAFVAASQANAGATSVSITSQVAASTHLVGEDVVPKYQLTAVGRGLSPVQTPRLKRL